MQHDNNSTGSAALIFMLLLVAILLLVVVGGGMAFMYVRQSVARQQAIMQVERAAAESARALVEQRRALDEQLENVENGALDSPRTDSSDTDEVEQVVLGLLEKQQSAWNSRDVDGLMSVYWNSSDLTRTLNGEAVRGWDDLRQLYRQELPTNEVETRQYTNLNFRRIGQDAALVTAQIVFGDAPDSQPGQLTAMIERKAGRWLIVHQHESR